MDRVALPDSSVTVYGYPHGSPEQVPAGADVGETAEKRRIFLHDSDRVTEGGSGLPVCCNTVDPVHDTPGNPDPSCITGVLRSIRKTDSYIQQTAISVMIPVFLVPDFWGDYLQKAHV